MISQSVRSLTRSAVYLLLYQQDYLLLARRYQTGFEDSNYSLVAGYLENQESVMQAAIREAHEEVGIIVAPLDLEFVHVMHRKSEDDLVYFDFFLLSMSRRVKLSTVSQTRVMIWAGFLWLICHRTHSLIFVLC